MHLGLEEALPSLVRAKFTAAKASQALIFSSTELAVLKTRSGTPFQLRYCPALAKKPKSNDNKPTKPAEGAKKFDPFDDPSADLLVANIPKQDPSHLLVLNKYPVIPEHFIVATRLNKQQTHMLEKDDLAATHACLRSWEEEGKDGRLFAFFNSGEHSGASQPHRHLQFLPVDEMKRDRKDSDWEPLIEFMKDKLEGEPSSGMKIAKGIPFVHYALPLPFNPTAEVLQSTYQKLYDAAAAAVRSYIKEKGDLELHPTEGGSSPISYNLAMTTTAMAICPRRREAATLRDGTGKEVGSVALNGTLLGGTLMVKSEEEWDLLREDRSQLEDVLATIGIPR